MHLHQLGPSTAQAQPGAQAPTAPKGVDGKCTRHARRGACHDAARTAARQRGPDTTAADRALWLLAQAERQTTDWQRKVLNLPALSWTTLDQAKDPVLRHAELWAAWADMQAAFVSWTSKPLLDSTNKVSSGPDQARQSAWLRGSISCRQPSSLPMPWCPALLGAVIQPLPHGMDLSLEAVGAWLGRFRV